MLWKDFFPGPIYLQQTFSKPFLTFSNISASMSPTWLPYKNQKGFCSRPNGYTRRGFSAFSADSASSVRRGCRGNSYGTRPGFCALISNKIRLYDTGTKGPFTHVYELKGVVLLEEQAGKA